MDLAVDAPVEASVAKPHDITLSLLYLNGVSVTFDGFRAINNLSLELAPGEMRAIIGPNGAGKTTMMDIITGKTRPDVGDVLFDRGSIDLTTQDEAAIAQLGIGRKFQKPTVFENHTVEDNILLALKEKALVDQFLAKYHPRLERLWGARTMPTNRVMFRIVPSHVRSWGLG